MTDAYTSAAKSRPLVDTEHTPKVAASGSLFLTPQFTIHTHFGDKLTFILKIAAISKRPKWGTPNLASFSLTQYNTQSSCVPSISFLCFWNHLWDMSFLIEVQWAAQWLYPSGDLQVGHDLLLSWSSRTKNWRCKGISQLQLRNKFSALSKSKLFLWIMLIQTRKEANYFFLKSGRHHICNTWLLLFLTWIHFSQLHNFPQLEVLKKCTMVS